VEERAVWLSSPEALAEDARSRTAFVGYKRGEAVALAKQVFGLAMPRWTPPQDQGSGHITSYVGENMADEVLPDGRHVLVDSSVPLRSAQGSGQLKPVVLGLSSTASGYVPANPLVPLVIGKSAAEGVAFQFGLRMTPTAHAAPESAEVVGNSVFYPGTAKDTDFMLEPRPMGVEASWQLLSAESPSENSLSFMLPAGAELKLSKAVEGAAERTTTFGVPISEKPQDKYGWLGTEGITSNLSSGTIVHDGITYVPQLDMPIQAEGTPVPAPALTIAPYVITVTAPEGFKGEEALAKAEGAGPSGDLPTPEGENFGMAGGCSGDGACASGNTECQGFSLLTELEHGEQTAIAIDGKTICSKKVEVIKVEVCLYEWQGGNGNGPDGFSKLKCGANKRFNASQVFAEVYDSSCKTGGTYLGWVWTNARSGSWSSYLKEPHLTNTVECTGQFPISPEELLEWMDGASKIGEK
jgi:hypothetical protein